jgi:hypothetical protein
MKNYEDCVDVQPMIISLDNQKWYNPFIKEWFSPNIDPEMKKNDFGYDEEVYRMYLTNDNGDNMGVYFKSDYINKKLSKWSESGNYESDNEEDWPDNKTLFTEYVKTQEVFDCICLILLEDFWCPSNPNKTKFEEQFCFTEFGKKVSQFFNVGEVKMDWFSLDCGMTTNGKDWWCDS